MNEAKIEICPRIYTRCPACNNDTLTINKGHLICTWIECPAPTRIDRADGRHPEAAPTAEAIAGSSSATLLAAFDDALNQNPFLWIEIGYTRPTDWMVHVWDRTRKADDGKIITTQSTSRDEACHEATQKLRDYLARGSS